MNEFNYYIFRLNSDKKVVKIKNISYKFPKSFKLDKGIQVADLLTPDTAFNIHPESGDMRTDFISNTTGCVIISEEVKTFFEQEGLADKKEIEYLPFVLYDKIGRQLKSQYYIANSLVCIDCFDFEKSKYTQDEDDGELLDVETAELVRDKIPENAIFFRIGEYPSRIVIRSDFLDKLREKGFTGISVVSTGERFV